MKNGRHHDHDCAVFKKAFERYKEEITSSIELMDKQVSTIEKALAHLDACCEEISNQRAVTEDNIHITFRREVLKVRETELTGHLNQITQEKLKALAVQRDQIETTLAQLNSCLHYMKESLIIPSNEGDVLTMKANTVRQAQELNVSFQPDFLEPNIKADIVFSAQVDMTATCKNHGQVYAPGLPYPSKCHIMGKGAEVTVVGVKSMAILQAISFEGKPCEEPMKSLECELVSDITGTRANCSIERKGQSQYEISYQPTVKGRHQLHINVQGQRIRGSPLCLAAKSPVEKLSDPILTIGGVSGAWGVAVNQMGEVVVAEYHGDCVSVFYPSGEKLISFGKQGSDHGEFDGPGGVAVDGEGKILVTDRGNHRIQKFTAQGHFIAAVGNRGSGLLQFSNPTDIAYNAKNRMVYVMDSGNSRVQVLNSCLTFSSTFGEKGSGKGQFNEPCGVACDSTGKVYVADGGNHCIQVFSAEGKFLRMFGRRGWGGGRCGDLDSLNYIAIGDNGRNLYVTDWDNVSLFTSQGQFLKSFGEYLEIPQGVAVDDSGVVYVRYHDCIRVF